MSLKTCVIMQLASLYLISFMVIYLISFMVISHKTYETEEILAKLSIQELAKSLTFIMSKFYFTTMPHNYKLITDCQLH